MWRALFWVGAGRGRRPPLTSPSPLTTGGDAWELQMADGARRGVPGVDRAGSGNVPAATRRQQGQSSDFSHPPFGPPPPLGSTGGVSILAGGGRGDGLQSGSGAERWGVGRPRG